jgi:hypothetical protein
MVLCGCGLYCLESAAFILSVEEDSEAEGSLLLQNVCNADHLHIMLLLKTVFSIILNFCPSPVIRYQISNTVRPAYNEFKALESNSEPLMVTMQFLNSSYSTPCDSINLTRSYVG